jgi:hypothetical protein
MHGVVNMNGMDFGLLEEKGADKTPVYQIRAKRIAFRSSFRLSI